MTYLETIKKAHDLVCHARNLMNELSGDLCTDSDVYVEVDHLIDDLTAQLEEVEDALFTGCNVDDINDLAKALEV